LYDFARNVDCSRIEIEQDGKLGRDQIARQRAEVGQLAPKRLSDFKPFDIAKQAATTEIERLRNARI
jgi:hypothetical protein